MRKASSIILAILVFVLTPIVLLGWGFKTTLLNPNFYGDALDKSDILPQFTQSLVDEYVKDQLLNGAALPYISNDELEVQIDEIIENICDEEIEGCSGEEWAEELDRWLATNEPTSSLDLSISLGEFKTRIPELIEVQYTEFLEELPTCTAEDARAYVVNPKGDDLPLCRPPEAFAGLISQFAQPEIVLDTFSSQVATQLDLIPDVISTRAFFAGEIPNFEPTPYQVEAWDEGGEQLRRYIHEVEIILWIVTGILVWLIIGLAAIQIPYWRKVLQWSTIPVTIPATVIFLFAGALWLAGRTIADIVFVRTESSLEDIPVYAQDLLYELFQILVTSFFGRIAIISGAIALTLLIIYIISFFLKKREVKE